MSLAALIENNEEFNFENYMVYAQRAEQQEYVNCSNCGSAIYPCTDKDNNKRFITIIKRSEKDHNPPNKIFLCAECNNENAIKRFFKRR